MQDKPCVAWERELARLQAFLDRALAGRGQVCFVSGQAGAGKGALMSPPGRQQRPPGISKRPYSVEMDRGLGLQQGQEPAVTALSFLSWVLWTLGYPDQAVCCE